MRILRPFLALLLAAVIAGCIFDDGDSSPSEPESYTLHIEPLGLDTHPGGGGLILLSLDPGPDFTGNVFVRATAPQNVQVVPQYVRLTRERPFAEIEVAVDSTAALGETEMALTATHEGVPYTTPVPINTYVLSRMLTDKGELSGSSWTVIDFLRENYPEHGEIGHNPPVAFTAWMMEHHPEYGITADNSWSCWCENHRQRVEIFNMAPVYRYINDYWDVAVKNYTNDPYYVELDGIISWYSIRKRWTGDMPILYLKVVDTDKRIITTGHFEEISADEFGALK